MIKLPRHTTDWFGKTLTLQWTGRYGQICNEKFFVEFEDPYSHYEGIRFSDGEELTESKLRFTAISEDSERITVVLVEDGKTFQKGMNYDTLM